MIFLILVAYTTVNIDQIEDITLTLKRCTAETKYSRQRNDSLTCPVR